MFPWIKKIFEAKAGDLLKIAVDGADKLFTSKEERAAYELKKEQEINRHLETIMEDITHQMELVIADKQNAREMYKFSSSLQKIYALVFLIAYIALTAGMIWMIYSIAQSKIELPEWGTVFISSIWGAMSAKVSTVTDFLFGAGMDAKKPG